MLLSAATVLGGGTTRTEGVESSADSTMTELAAAAAELD